MVLTGLARECMVLMRMVTRAHCGRSLKGCAPRWVIPWCLIGDFNIIRYIGERLGCDSYSSTKCAFLNFIENNNLVYLPLEGASYTWFRDSDAPSMSRIDRNLVLINWEDPKIILWMSFRGFFLVLFQINVLFW